MTETLASFAAALAIAAMLCFTAARAWRGWLDLKRLELARRGPDAQAEEDVGLRIELADVRERLKKLEAIANGVDI